MNKFISNNHSSNFYNNLLELLEDCKSFYFSVAFVNFSGTQLLLDSFKKLEKKGIKGKLLTSTYLNFTEPKALKKLDEFENLEIKIFDCENEKKGFHSKAYIFEYENEYKLLIGSSNITSSAFKSNIEWNIKTVSKKDDIFIKDIFEEFENLWDNSIVLNESFLKSYEQFYTKKRVEKFVYKDKIDANYMQKKALEKLEFLRANGERKALAIASTGSGKTYLALLDVLKFNPKRVLFIVHRENILLKAKASFEKFFQNECGLFTGNKKEAESRLVFATIQTLTIHFKSFVKEQFDYIIVDEAHHISSPSYKKVYDYFEAKFLLGLTATPNRSDDSSIYDYFDDNIACDIRLSDALEENLIAPFHYYGINDICVNLEDVDIKEIQKLAKLLMINKRVDFIIEKMNFYGFSGKKRKVLAFCVSKEHAKYMSDEFNKRGIPSTFLSSDDSINSREYSIRRLENLHDDLEIIFSVDIFNEGIDIPSINTVLMLRPTSSSIVFTQQLGRGLRKNDSKEFLTLIDFIGNHNKTYLIAYALVGDKIIDKESLKIALLNNFAAVSNAHIKIDEISKNQIIKQIDDENFSSMKYLKEQYFEFKSILGNKIPSLVDFIDYNNLLSPITFISETKSYIEFLAKVEKEEPFVELSKDAEFIKAIRFIEGLLPIKRVYEFVILKYLLENKTCSIEKTKELLEKYLKVVNQQTIEHSFKYLNQDYFDSAQKSRFLKLVDLKENKLSRSLEFEKILGESLKKELLEDSLNYGIVCYEKSFGIEDYKLPFLKLYEKYNMLEIAKLCNFNKIHSSFRGSGFLKFKNDFFLFITIEKDKFAKASKYHNAFINRELFTYSSKPSHTQDKGDGQRLINNLDVEVNLHIFVRKFSHVDKKVQRFIYLGLADTVEYKNNKPIDCILKLHEPLSKSLFEEFTKIC